MNMKYIIIWIVIILIFIWYKWNEYYSKFTKSSIEKAIDWMSISNITILSEWLNKYKLDLNHYPSIDDFDNFLKRYVHDINKNVIRDRGILYEVTDDLKHYKISIKLID